MAGSTGSRSSRSKGTAAEGTAQDSAQDSAQESAPEQEQAEVVEQDATVAAVEPLGGAVVETGVPAGGADPDAADERAATRGGAPTYYLNMTNGPLVYNADGQSVDGSSWTPEPIVLDAIGQQQRDRGNLLPKSAL